MAPAGVTIRPARREDAAALLSLVRELADFEGAPEQVVTTEADLVAALFCEHPRVHAHVADRQGAVQAMVVWFVNYSTWTGRHGIYVEDLVVTPGARGLGLGRALLTELARLALARGYTRMDWAVLDWNQPAIDFYRHLGASALEDWVPFRLDLAGISALARPD